MAGTFDRAVFDSNVFDTGGAATVEISYRSRDAGHEGRSYSSRSQRSYRQNRGR